MSIDEKSRIELNIAAARDLLQLADKLRRASLRRIGFSQADWSRAVQRVQNSPEGQPSDSESTIDAIRLVHKAARRLGNSGDARFSSLSVGRQPDSSHAGRRFNDDIELMAERVTALESLIAASGTQQGTAAERSHLRS